MSLENTISEAIKTAMRERQSCFGFSSCCKISDILLKQKPEVQKFLQNRKLLFFRE
jgi:hypothetical protein